MEMRGVTDMLCKIAKNSEEKDGAPLMVETRDR